MSFFLDLIKTLCLGLIQGVTEWLPISSTGHLLIFNSILPMYPTAFFDVFKVVIQFGSILAVIKLYRSQLVPKSIRSKRVIRLWTKIIVGSIPAAILGLLLNDLVDQVLSSNFVIGITLIVYGIIFIVVERMHHRPHLEKIDQISYLTALKLGCFQALALVPGTSRSGATIIGGLLVGCTRTLASEFSFFLAIPTMAGASLLKIFKYIHGTGFFSIGQLVLLVLGTWIAYVVSLVVIKSLLAFVRKHDFTAFGYYRIGLGLFLFIFFYLL